MTYWVRGYNGGNGGTGDGSTGDGSEESGSGKYSMKYTIVYHSNYPSGTDYKQTYKYTIYAGYNIGNTGRKVDVKSPNELGFTAPAGYKPKSTPWNTKADGTGEGVSTMLFVKPNSTYDIYAQWEGALEQWIVTYKDGTKDVGTDYVTKGDSTVAHGALTKDGHTFKGWSETDGGMVKYQAGDEFTPVDNVTLYAVWEDNNTPIVPPTPPTPPTPEKPVVSALEKFPVFDFLRNYIASFGIIILILVILVKLVISPLTYKSYVSMAKMRLIKPQVDELNKKYPKKEDAMKKQQATMELYKKAGINPMGGCIPMLIQMPILIAMFRFFPASIELREQPFLWADDLSSYDSIVNLPFSIPFYGDHVSLFALLMAVSLFGYSYFNYQQTASSQPQMAGMKFMMVYMMPIMMLLWFNSYSSGLCYYYLLSNLFTIGQTLLIRRMVDDDKIHAVMQANAAKRSKGKKSKFQQRYEELLRQQEAQQRTKRK